MGKLQEHLGITESFDEYISVDSNIPTTQNLTDDAIIQTVIVARDTKNEEQSSDKENENDEPTKIEIFTYLYLICEIKFEVDIF